MNKLPKTRTQNFVVQETANELLVYDLITNKAFCLNETAAIVFNACDGKTSFAELNRKHNFTDELIFLTLDSLSKENLLDENFSSPFDKMKRREIIKKIGLATMITLPIISSLVAPTAAAASSLCVSGGANLPPGRSASCSDSVSECDLLACDRCLSQTGTLITETGPDTTCRDLGFTSQCICN
ncbi:MAG: hypothetical protein AAB336_09805 [Acidobacteriota bacterium]